MIKRSAGVLLAVSSLPSKYGIGCFDRNAYKFVDMLRDAGQTYWQILPLCPTGYGDSPYQSFSTFAGNPYFISLEELIKRGLLTEKECDIYTEDDPESVDYYKLYKTRFELLRKAYGRFDADSAEDFRVFREENEWLDDYALFMALKDKFGGRSFSKWDDDIRLRKPEAMRRYSEELKEDVGFYRFLQYLFQSQWTALKAYANRNGIKIIGDIPIYVAADSADVWASPELFQLDENGLPTAVAGCPPDAFTEDGQLWGNPLYNWERHRETGYKWWIDRMAHCFRLYDVVRIDHFRGFDEYYSIPFGEKTARNGTWEKGPGPELFKATEKALGRKEIIVEDLGFVTDTVKQLVKDCGFPNMKILEFAFDPNDPDGSNDFLPHNYSENCAVYTGTHDNQTLVSWFAELPENIKELARSYLCDDVTRGDKLYKKFIALLMRSRSDLCVIPMQDWLGLNDKARMNTPSTVGQNWKWRMKADAFTKELSGEILTMTKICGRANPMALRKGRNNMNVSEVMMNAYNRPISECSDEEIYNALLCETQKLAEGKSRPESKKKLYYFSAEFLIGKLLSNNLINLGVYDDVKRQLAESGKDLCKIEEIENEPSLGNGGLGRLAACFLDSIATLGLNGDGVGLRYHFGLFKQVFKDNQQTAVPDKWLTDNSWLTRTDRAYTVKFRDLSVTARMYDLNVTGYNNITNKLHLFDIDTADENFSGDGIDFDKNDIAKNLTLFLYPDDSDDAGRLLRIYQQYLMVSAGAQFLLDECAAKGCKLYDLSDYAVIQINDTHPTMIIPELIRLLVERGLDMDDAIEAVRKSCAYTNHTILAEALEKWPIDYLKKVVPQLVPIIEVLDDKVRRTFDDPRVCIIDKENRVHMAHIDIHYSISVNGVAALHTDILKNVELKHFYNIYPEKFNNKTNGVTFRRWLMYANPGLTELIASLIGDGFKKDAMELERLLRYKGDKTVLKKLLDIKQQKKKELKAHFLETRGIEIDENSIFDIQVKRLHEYKRQQLNLLFVIKKYLEIKDGKKPSTPITVIFGAKAAPAYTIAQDIIHLILCLSELINSDPDASPYLKVVMAENYNVTEAEKLIPACDISEQISLASKEASGTSNMKFILNGAVILGTDDGANVEIHELVGDDNIYIFGESSDQVVERYQRGDYNPKKYYEENADIKRAVDFIVSPELMKIGNKERLERLFNELIGKDWFMTFPDFDEYVKAREKAYADYENRIEWADKMLVNIAKAGFFSSDRTIEEYNRDIWKL